MEDIRRKQVIWILAVFGAVVVCDQVSKAVIRARIPLNDYTAATDGPRFFRFTHQHNTGLVGGLCTGNRIVAITAPLLATAVLVYLFKHLNPASKLQSIAYGLVAGGAIGNLMDRLLLGGVTDFLQFHFYFIPLDFPWKHYPAFNVADSAICTGVFILIVTWHFLDRHDVPDTN